ncbi:MAG: hypothetical protein U9P37_05550 [Pseudomonadota bacterium]|nr:hypothetical protein [Pseudomonadota bacterium]
MVFPTEGSVVLVKFPFSDFLSSKLRVLSKISSQNWRSDLGLICTIRLSKAAGIVSYARPAKLFTANSSLMEMEVGKLKAAIFKDIVNAVVDILKRSFLLLRYSAPFGVFCQYELQFVPFSA